MGTELEEEDGPGLENGGSGWMNLENNGKKRKVDERKEGGLERK
jgi:hypothetical protein